MTDIRQLREDVTSLISKMEEAKITVSEVNRTFTTYLSLANRAGLSGNIMDALRKLQQIRISIQLMLRALQLFEVTAGPLGWAVAIGTGMTALVAGADTLFEVVS